VLAHILGEVGNFYIVLLSVSSRTCLPIFIEINLYLTELEQKLCWHIFFETQYMCNFSFSLHSEFLLFPSILYFVYNSIINTYPLSFILSDWSSPFPSCFFSKIESCKVNLCQFRIHMKLLQSSNAMYELNFIFQWIFIIMLIIVVISHHRFCYCRCCF